MSNSKASEQETTKAAAEHAAARVKDTTASATSAAKEAVDKTTATAAQAATSTFAGSRDAFAASRDAAAASFAASKEAATSTYNVSKDVIASASATYRDMTRETVEMASKLAAFNKGNISAYTESGKIFSQEMQALFRQFTACLQVGTAETLAEYRALLSAKTFKERLELQTTMSRTAAIWMISESSNFARSGIDMAEKVAAPVIARAALAAQVLDAAAA